MKAIIIGAGRGKRLQHFTDDVPKTMVPIVGKPMIEHVLSALAAGGFGSDRTIFICGYKSEVIQRAYPQLTYVRNHDWPHNNILLSLLYAREHLGNGFLSSYSDIVYRAEAVTKLMASAHAITLVCDTEWRVRYRGRSQHPESDAEKMRADGSRIVELSRHIPSEQAAGEFIGVMRMTAAGAAQFLSAFDAQRARYRDDEVFREGRPFAKAYLIDLLQHMLEQGVEMHRVNMSGGYMEIDTTQDAALSQRWWSRGQPR